MRIFIFGPPDFFADVVAGFFLLIFVGKSAQTNPPGKSPAKSSKIYHNKNPRHISAEAPGQNSPLFPRASGLPAHRSFEVPGFALSSFPGLLRTLN